MPVKMATQAKPASSTKSRSVLKVAYEEEVEDFDAPPAAPASIEVVQEEVQPEVRVVAKPVFRARPATSDAPVNPLR